MQTRTHVHEEVFASSADRVFALLHTPSAIRQWWGAASAIVVPERGGLWAAAWGLNEDAPEFVTYAWTRSTIIPFVSDVVLANVEKRLRFFLDLI